VCVCVCVCVCVRAGAILVARTIGHLCGRTENDRNSSHYSRSKKEASLAGRDRPDFRLRRGFPLHCPIAHGMGWDELEIEAFSRGLSGGLGGFCWLGCRDPPSDNEGSNVFESMGWFYDKRFEVQLIRKFVII